MSDGPRLKWVWAALIGVVAFTGCGQANAGDGELNKPNPKVAAVGERDARPSSDADADNGPGCAESSLAAAAHQQKRKLLETK
jgi:hypothetical protein